MRNIYALPLLLALGNPLLAMDKSGYRLMLDARIEDHKLTMAPQIHAPAGAVLRYEVIVAKTGTSGTTSTRQGGEVRVNEHNTATLSKLSLSIGPQDRWTVLVKVYDGQDIVAERSFSHPDSPSGAVPR
jgi:hypothetical protein